MEHEAAQVLGLGRTTVYELMAQGKLASTMVGRCRRLKRAELQRYIRELPES